MRIPSNIDTPNNAEFSPEAEEEEELIREHIVKNMERKKMGLKPLDYVPENEDF